jgi:hypothetical protein
MAVIAFGAVVVAGAASGESAFVKIGPETVYDAGDRCGVPHWAVADFNRDGRADFALGNTPWSSFVPPSSPGALMLWIAQPDGSYREQAAQLFSGPVTAPYTFADVLVADFNGDGVPDVYVPDYGPDNSGTLRESTPKLALSTPAGFVDASARFAGLAPRLIHTGAIADIDGNGTVDLYVGSNTGAPVPGKKPYLLLNDGNGNFTFDQSRLPAVVLSQVPQQGARSRQIDATTWHIADERFPGSMFLDVNRDGFPDLVLLQAPLMPNGLVLLNDGHGDFSKLPPIDLPPAVNGGNWLVGKKNASGNWIFPMQAAPGESTGALEARAADLNGDGWPDLVVQEHKCLLQPALTCYSGGYLQILINQAGRGFVDETAVRGAPGVESDNGRNNYQGTLQVVDINGDGAPDLVAPLLWPYASHFYLNDGQGRFARATLPGLPEDGRHIVINGSPGQPTRIVHVRFDWRYNTPVPNANQCTLRVQTYERPAPVVAPPATIQPVGGVWWDPNESGSGYGLDYRDGVLVLQVYSYTAGGAAQWYLGAGAVTGNVFRATLDKYVGGQCISCGYRAPAIAGNDGEVTLTFTSPTTADIALPGGRRGHIQRYFASVPTQPAGAPVGGVWWDPNESGSGYGLDYRDGLLILQVYSYTAGGAAQWYLGAGAVTDNVFSGRLDRYTGGQCISCAYVAPSIAGSDGRVTITFTSPTTADISLPGGRTGHIRRYFPP